MSFHFETTDRDPDRYLTDLMRDPRYWDPARADDRYRDAIAKLFDAVYPGDYQPGSWGKNRRPAIAYEDLLIRADAVLPGPENPASLFRVGRIPTYGRSTVVPRVC